jgi:hypothetical protein
VVKVFFEKKSISIPQMCPLKPFKEGLERCPPKLPYLNPKR